MKNKNNKNFVEKENKTVENKYTNKDIFFNSLKAINNKLDFTRNAIFNIIVTNNYINSIEFEFKNEIKEINDYISDIEDNLEIIIKCLNIKFEERKN